ncbi:MAG: exonuclease SbcCD subunit D, partial [Nitrospinota bacterium]
FECAIGVLGRLKERGVRTYLIPGNHDPELPGGLWEREEWGRVAHVFRLRDPGPLWQKVPDLDLIVAGMPYDRDHPDARPMEERRAYPERIDLPIILLLHGCYDGIRAQDSRWNLEDRPFSKEELRRTPFCYSALGHYHRPMTCLEEEGRMALYPGTPEGTDLNHRNTGERSVVVGEISRDGRVTLARRPVNRRRLETERWDISTFGPGELTRRAESLAGEDVLLRLDLEGAPSAEVLEEAEGLRDALGARFFHLKVDLLEVCPPADAPADPRFLPGRFARKMVERIESAGSTEEADLCREALRVGLDVFRGPARR